MGFGDQHRKQLQALMSQPQWQGFEAFFQDYMARNFVQNSIKRQTEFETLWQAAESEGARIHLKNFKEEMEREAQKV